MSTIRTEAGWRISARSDAANTCVEARIDGDAVVVRNSTDPHGPSIVVPSSAWLTLLDHVAAGRADCSVLGEPVVAGPFVVSLDPGGQVRLCCGEDIVGFTKAEWDVFVAGVTLDGEFTLQWLLEAQSLTQSASQE